MYYENITEVGFTHTEKLYLISCRVFVSFLSLLGSLFIMISILMFRKLQHMSFRLIFQLTFASFLESIANLVTVSVLVHLSVPGIEDPLLQGPLCDFQGTLLQFSQLATFGWITSIAINFYLVVAQGKSQNEFEVYYNACVWLIAVALTLVPLSTPGAYGQAGSWCWLTLKEGQIYRWCTFYAPLLLITIMVSVLYIRLARNLKNKIIEGTEQNSVSDTKERLERLTLRLRAYPVVLISLYIFPLINRGYEAATKQNLFPLAMLQCITAPALGFANAIVYGLDIEMRYLWAQLLARYCCCTSCCTLIYEYKETSEEDIHFWDENTPLVE